jgi:succinate-semialdehyde dehydrogenase/glutarate-semialdehyde dehydrogenase
MAIQSVNPFTGEVIKDYSELSVESVNQAIQQVQQAFLEWRNTGFSDRSALMQQAARVIRQDIEAYAALMVQEMGKTIREGRAEAEKCAWVCEHYAAQAEAYLTEEIIPTDAKKSYVAFQPLGVVLAVMPWNFPLWQVFRFAAPALMAGNGGLLKHASNVPGCALAIESIFEKAGFPANLFKTLLITSRLVNGVIENPLVKAVTLTGSTPAGRQVAKKAGEMLKKTVLELGGSDPYIVLEDADLEAAATICTTGRLINSGQSCIAAKRFIVVDSIREKFESLFAEKMKQKEMGDPMDEKTDIGPMARHDLRDELHEQVRQSIEKGARCILGGEIPKEKGAFYPPTILTNVQQGMPAYDDELFGPVASLISAKDEKEAVRKANDSVFGLGACVITGDIERGERIAKEELEAGCCFVNTFVKSDPRLPFGGLKESGYGRELAHYGIKEFVNIKTVYIK